VVAVNGLAANVGVEVNGDYGGTFTINADGTWTFSPAEICIVGGL
jgi:VCBS repeat-containing protein